MHGINIHQVKHIHASRHDYAEAPLTLNINVDGNYLPSSITLYLDDDALTTALVKAINDTVAEHAERKAEAAAAIEAA